MYIWLIFSVQKVIPYLVIFIVEKRVNFFVFMRALVAVLGSYIQLNIKLLLSYTSLMSMGWILRAFNIRLGLGFYLLYVIRIRFIVFFFDKLSLTYMRDFSTLER